VSPGEKAQIKLEELRREYFELNKWNFKNEAEYNTRCYWHIHTVEDELTELTGGTRCGMPRGERTMGQDNEKSVNGVGNVLVERMVRPIGGEPSKMWMDYMQYLESRSAAMVETLKEVDQVITVEAALQPNKEYGWTEWRDEHVRPWLA
jgi:hypothetical protein